jgi:serine/threonine-protein kinase RsbT
MNVKMADNKEQKSEGSQAVSFAISSDYDIVKIREQAKTIAEKIGFSSAERTLIATAVSEICRNVIEYAQEGEITIKTVIRNPNGITITVCDKGPGIIDIKKAMEDGFSTRRGMGIGLPGSKRIMDEFEIESGPGKGTKVVMSKWIK